MEGIVEPFITLCEVLGVVAFAFSGSITAIERRLDFFGVLVLAVITAMGGGVIRDLILGITPPTMFIQPQYLIAASLTALVSFIVSKRRRLIKEGGYAVFLRFIAVCDAVGLGIFTVVGAGKAIGAGHTSVFLCVFVGTLTGIGGGILRDVLVHRVPLVLKREIYATASILGAVVYCCLQRVLVPVAALTVSCGLIASLRLLAVKYNWQLPK